jgi:hypothetical protein
MSLDFSRCRYPPFQHQREDVAWLLERPYALVASEMRTGKTKICIDTAHFLFERGEIDTVIVVAPAPVRDVWADRDLGEIAKHSWANVPVRVTEFHARLRTWKNDAAIRTPKDRILDWVVTNYEFLRSKNRLTQLLPSCGPRTLIIFDESSFIKNPTAQQSKACKALRNKCGRVILLNGTPIFHSPRDLYNQANMLHPSVLECPSMTHFEARYAIKQPVLGYGGKALTTPYGHVIQKVVDWTNLEDLRRRFAPVTVRRLQADCLDLPPKLDSVALTAVLSDTEWAAYKQMKEELVVWLKSGEVAVSSTAAIRALRLSQITSGFVGGIEEARIDGEPDMDLLDALELPPPSFEDECRDALGGFDPPVGEPVTWQPVGRAKLDVLLWFIEQQLERDPNLHLVAWCRFRAELFRTLAEIREKFPQFETAAIHGGQKKAERLRALSLLHPQTSPKGPVFAIGIEGTGSFGLNMTASHTCITLSSGYSPGRSAQTLDRVYGPGQTEPIAYFDVVAVGPKGQRTIDHAILLARRSGQDVANWTAQAWVKALTEE